MYMYLSRSILEACNEVDMVCMILHNCTCVEELGANRRLALRCHYDVITKSLPFTIRNDLIASSEGLAILSHVIPSPSDDSGMEWRYRNILISARLSHMIFLSLQTCVGQFSCSLS